MFNKTGNNWIIQFDRSIVNASFIKKYFLFSNVMSLFSSVAFRAERLQNAAGTCWKKDFFCGSPHSARPTRCYPDAIRRTKCSFVFHVDSKARPVKFWVGARELRHRFVRRPIAIRLLYCAGTQLCPRPHAAVSVELKRIWEITWRSKLSSWTRQITRSRNRPQAVETRNEFYWAH